jgi:hypothetical protein
MLPHLARTAAMQETTRLSFFREPPDDEDDDENDREPPKKKQKKERVKQVPAPVREIPGQTVGRILSDGPCDRSILIPSHVSRSSKPTRRGRSQCRKRSTTS